MATIEILAIDALPCLIADAYPTMAIGRQPSRYNSPFYQLKSAEPPRTPIWARVMKAISKP